MASVADQLPGRASSLPLRPVPWIGLLWFAALLILGSYPILNHLAQQWATDEDVNHGFLVPLVAAWIAWGRRDRILALKLQPAWWGLGVIAWGTAQSYLGWLGAEQFLQRSSFLILLVGVL